MKKVVLTIGVPGSGKSTWAKEETKKLSTIVLTRDDMRMMLVGGGNYKYSRSRETNVTNFMQECLKSALKNETTQRIIIADTNLNPATRNMFEKIANEFGAEIEYKTFDVDWSTLKKRNESRGDKAVPIQVLRDMYTKMKIFLGTHKTYVPNVSLPKAVIFDIDGTLADNSHRNPFEFSKCGDDKPIQWVIDILNMYKNSGHKIICLSGRNSGTKHHPYAYYNLTKQWLIDNNIDFHNLFMRGAEDFRKDDVIKEELFWDISKHFNIVGCFDDRQNVVEMWRRIGVNCCQTEFGDF